MIQPETCNMIFMTSYRVKSKNSRIYRLNKKIKLNNYGTKSSIITIQEFRRIQIRV